MFYSCATTSNFVVSNGVDLSKYKYVCFGNNQSGDRGLDDLILMVENEISNTRLQTIFIENPPIDYLYKTLSPNIHISSELWEGGHTYITITFYDYSNHRSVAVVKSSGIGLTVEHDKQLALNAIRN